MITQEGSGAASIPVGKGVRERKERGGPVIFLKSMPQAAPSGERKKKEIFSRSDDYPSDWEMSEEEEKRGEKEAVASPPSKKACLLG